MLGVELVTDRATKEPAKAETMAAFERMKDLGVLVGKGGLYGNVFRIKPPMCFSMDDAGGWGTHVWSTAPWTQSFLIDLTRLTPMHVPTRMWEGLFREICLALGNFVACRNSLIAYPVRLFNA